MDSFQGEPVLIPHADGVHWDLDKPFVAWDDDLGRIEVPLEFVTDLGSIPKIFQNVISPEGRPLRAYLIHDYLYATQRFTRAKADACLMRMMAALRVPWYERWTIYLAVRAGGWSAWNSDAKEKNR